MTALLEPMLEFDRVFNRMFSFSGLRSAFSPDADVIVTDDDVTVQMDLRGQRYADPAAVVQFGRDITRELSAIAGAESAFLWGPGRPGRPGG